MNSYNAKNSILPAIPMAKRGQSFAKVNAATGRLKNAFTGKMLNGGSFLPSAVAQELDRKRNPRLSSIINTSKMPNGGVTELALDAASLVPGPVGMWASGAGLLYDLNQGDWVGAGLNTANILTGGTAKGAMAAARYLNNAGARNLARGLAQTSHNLNRANNITKSVSKPADITRNFLYSISGNNTTQFGGHSDNTRIAPIVHPKMPNGGLFPVGDYDRTLAPKQGNYLLPDINRPSYIHEDGKRRSEYRVGMNIDGEETLIPTVVNGRQLTDDEALQRYQKTGLHMGKYKTPEEADFQSRLRTAKYNMLEDPLHFTANQFMMGGMAIPQVNGTVVASAPSSLYSKYKKRKKS